VGYPVCSEKAVLHLLRVFGDATFRFRRKVRALAIAADGSIGAGADDGTVRVWHLASRRERRALSVAGTTTSALGLSSDGAWVAVGDSRGNLGVWETASGRQLWSVKGHAQGVSAVAFSPVGDVLISGSDDGLLRSWQVGSGEEMQTYGPTAGYSINAIGFTPDGTRCITGGRGRPLECWDLARGTVTWSRDTVSNVLCVDVSQDGELVAVGAEKGALQLWAVSRGRLARGLEGQHTYPVTSVKFSADGARVLSGASNGVFVRWHTSDASAEWVHRHRGSSSPMVLARTGTVLSANQRSVVDAWSFDEPASPEPRFHTGSISGSFCPPDAAYAVTAGEDGRVILSGIDDDFETLLFEHPHALNSLFVAEEGLALVGDTRGTLALVDLRKGKTKWAVEAHGRSVSSCGLDSDGKRAVSASDFDATPKVWGVGTKAGRAYKGHEKPVSGLVMAGSRVLSGSRDRSVQLWTLGRSLVHALRGHKHDLRCVAASADGVIGLSGAEFGEVRTWDLHEGRSLGPLRGHEATVIAAAIEGDGKRAATADADGNVILWSLKTRKVLDQLSLDEAGDSVTSLAFAEDASGLLAGTARGLMLVFSVRD
jgi:WD40 repeat protein